MKKLFVNVSIYCMQIIYFPFIKKKGQFGWKQLFSSACYHLLPSSSSLSLPSVKSLYNLSRLRVFLFGLNPRNHTHFTEILKNPFDFESPMIHHSQMLPQIQSLTTHLWPSLPLSKPTTITHFSPPKETPFRKSLFQTLKCSVSVASEPAHLELVRNKPFPAEVSRTIMELSSVATLSALTQDGWPLGVGVRFAVDPQGTPIVCLNASHRHFSIDRRSSLHVQVKSSSMYVCVY